MNKSFLTFILAVIALAFMSIATSCGQKKARYGGGDQPKGEVNGEEPTYDISEFENYSEVFTGIKENIDSMNDKPWDKAYYENLMANQITSKILEDETELSAAKAYSKAVYRNVMVRDANGILDGECSQPNAHGKLSAIVNEYSKFGELPTELAKKKSLHDQAVQFSASGIANQAVTSMDQDYDAQPENAKMQKANEWLGNSSLKCKIAREKITRFTNKSYYDGRRRAYCQAIVRLFKQMPNPTKADLNNAKGKMRFYPGNSEPLKHEMEKYYEEQKEKNAK